MKSASVLDGGIDGFDDDRDRQRSRGSLLGAVARRWRLVAFITLGCMAAAGVHLWMSTPLYRSEARVLLRRGSLQVVGDSGNSYTSNLQTQCRVIMSTRIVAAAATRALPHAPKTLLPATAVGNLVEGLSASVASGEELIAISFEGPEATEAAAVLQSVIDVYSELHAERKSEVLGQWQADLKRLQSEIEAKFKQADDLRQKSELAVDGAGVEGTSRDDLVAIREALSAASIEAVNAQAAYATLVDAIDPTKHGGAPSDPLPMVAEAIAADPAVRSLGEQLTVARDRVRDARLRFLDNHPSVQAALAQLASIESSMSLATARATENYLANLKQRAALASERQTRLGARYQALAQASARQGRGAAEIERREAELARLQKQADSIVARMQAFRLDADASSGTVEVVEYPSINLEAVKPHPARHITWGLAGGLIMGGACAMLLGAFDQRIRSAAQLATTMRLPVLGAIPRSRNGAGEEHDLGRAVVREPASIAAEAFRSVGTAVLRNSVQREPRTILITSAEAGEGKSTLASNLAIALARAGRKVLLIDGDLRKPVLHRIFQVLPRGDLAKIFANEQAVESAIQSSEVENLSLLLCGHAPDNPSELLNRPAFATLLEELSLRYDHVVLDSPPVGVASDARILSSLASVSMVVVRADRTHRAAVTLAFDSLSSVGGTVLGLVLNHASHRDDRFGSYGYEYSGRAAADRGARTGAEGTLVIPAPNLNKLGTAGRDDPGLKSLPA